MDQGLNPPGADRAWPLQSLEITLKTRALTASCVLGMALGAGSAHAALVGGLSQVSPLQITYVLGTDFSVMAFSYLETVTAAVAAVDVNSGTSGCDAADFAGFPAGYIALMSVGSCTFDVQATNAEAAGASGAIIFNSSSGLFAGTLGSGYAGTIGVLGLTRELGLEWASQGPLITARLSVTDSTPDTNSPVPVPGSLALLTVGAASLGIAFWQRKRRMRITAI
jgi:hypothetical protein